jgi:predicted lysophospholipase L1 biosynthesis ABC-type transport system permease subunit
MAGNPLTNPNWAPELADTIDKYVGAVRDKATRKAVVVVRALVFGLLIAVTAVVAVVVGIILGVKLLQRIVNIGGWIDADSSVWVSYVVMGVLLVIAGTWSMAKRSSKTA